MKFENESVEIESFEAHVAELCMALKVYQKTENISPGYMALILHEITAVKIRELIQRKLKK